MTHWEKDFSQTLWALIMKILFFINICAGITRKTDCKEFHLLNKLIESTECISRHESRCLDMSYSFLLPFKCTNNISIFHSQFILSSSITRGLFIIRVLILMIYSPRKPMKNNWSAPKNHTPMTSGAIPAEKESQCKHLYTK